jgi:hypothetical protein
VATYFGLIRPSSGQHSEICGAINACHVLWDAMLLARCTLKEFKITKIIKHILKVAKRYVMV